MTVALNLHKDSLNPVTVFFQLLLRALRDCIKSPQKLLRLLICGDKVHSVLLGAYNLGSFFGTCYCAALLLFLVLLLWQSQPVLVSCSRVAHIKHDYTTIKVLN